VPGAACNTHARNAYSRSTQHASCSMQHAARIRQHAAHSTQHVIASRCDCLLREVFGTTTK
jgi:hypothetical protein